MLIKTAAIRLISRARHINMPTGITVFHNPQCTKCRNSTCLLEENQAKAGYTLEIVKYKTNPPSREVLEKLVEYLGLNNKDASERPWDYLLRPEAQGKVGSFEEAFDVIANDPGLLERPFVIDWDNKRAALGRPDTSKIEELIASRKSA